MRERLARPPWAALAVFMAIKVGVTMAVADRYGWHRDELYYLASSNHLSLGYVDYPPITPLPARLDQLIFPRSLPGLRLLTVLAGTAVIVISALIARELGGNRTAQTLAGVAALLSPEFIGTNILFQTVSFDELTWALVCLIGLETKYTVIGLGVAILVGLLATPERRWLASRWPWLGLAIAMLMLAPNIVWQVTHNWDSVAYTLEHRGSTDGPILYWLQQVLLAGPLLLPAAVMGVIWMWRHERWRAAAITVVGVELIFFLAGGKSYYPAPIYPLAYAASSIWFVEAVARPIVRQLLIAANCIVTLILLPLGLPILPTQQMIDSQIWQIRKDYGDMIGWPELSQQVTTVYQQLPASDRASVIILASNYGQAGALDFNGRSLPTVVTPHLTYYYWAPAQMAPSTVIVVGYPRDYLAQFFGDIEEAGTIGNAYGMHNEEFGKSIWVCRNPKMTLRQAWPELKALD